MTNFSCLWLQPDLGYLECLSNLGLRVSEANRDHGGL